MGTDQLMAAAIKSRDLLANYLWNEDDSGDENDLVAAYDELRDILGPSTEEGVGATLATLDVARERPSALDVEALAEAMHAEHPSTFPAMGCCGDMARRILARLAEPDTGEGTERPHNHTIDGHHWHDCPGCDDGTPQHEATLQPEGGPE